jgi:transketolase
MNETEEASALERRALRARRDIIAMSGRGGCFLGAALSCVDVLVYLYSELLRVTPASVRDPDRDIFLMSKGHAVPALYAVLAERGFFPAERLERHLHVESGVYWHPNPSLPGVEFQSGSLGHLLSVGMGLALDARLRGSPRRVYVLLGDGELNEGSIWEGLLVAAAQELSNLIVIVDRNRLQANVPTEALVPLEPLADKLVAFNLGVASCDGHDFASLGRAFAAAAREASRPSIVIANTVRGKGLPSLEGRTDGWFVHAHVPTLLGELERAALRAPRRALPYVGEFEAGGPR